MSWLSLFLLRPRKLDTTNYKTFANNKIMIWTMCFFKDRFKWQEWNHRRMSFCFDLWCGFNAKIVNDAFFRGRTYRRWSVPRSNMIKRSRGKICNQYVAILHIERIRSMGRRSSNDITDKCLRYFSMFQTNWNPIVRIYRIIQYDVQ